MNNMNANEYQKLAKRTAPSVAVQNEGLIEKMRLNPPLATMLVAGMKLSSESGELNDSLVKHVCYNQSLDVENLIEECGDLLWYIALLLECCNTDMSVCMEENIEKLRIRYPKKYTDELAKIRLDKSKEQQKP